MVSSSFQFNDTEEEWVELFEIVDVTKFTKVYSPESTDKSTAVCFSDQGQIQEFDPDQATLQVKAKKVTLEDNSASDSGSESNEDTDNSNEESDEESESSTSSSFSNSADVLVQKPTVQTSKQSTNITSAVSNDAKKIASILISNTTGSGSFNV